MSLYIVEFDNLEEGLKNVKDTAQKTSHHLLLNGIWNTFTK